MSINLNALTISGRLTRDAEKRDFSKGGCVVSFDIGFLESKYKDSDGKWQYKNGFVTIKRFYNDNGNPDWLLEAAVKGTDVIVTGKLGFEQWEKDGEKKSKLTIIADNVQFMNASSSTERGADNRRTHKGYKGKAGRDTGGNSSRYDAPDPDDGDDTPF